MRTVERCMCGERVLSHTVRRQQGPTMSVVMNKGLPVSVTMSEVLSHEIRVRVLLPDPLMMSLVVRVEIVELVAYVVRIDAPRGLINWRLSFVKMASTNNA